MKTMKEYRVQGISISDKQISTNVWSSVSNACNVHVSGSDSKNARIKLIMINIITSSLHTYCPFSPDSVSRIIPLHF